MGYQKYGIPRELVESIKQKLKDPAAKERVKSMLEGVTKSDLQDRAKVKALLAQVSRTLNEPISAALSERIADVVIDLKIDPNNTFHLIKLWGMFR